MNTHDLERQLELEKLIAEVARKFVMVNEVTDAVNEALERIGTFCDAGRAYLFEFDSSRKFMHNTFEWCDRGVEPEQHKLQNLPLSMFPWWIQQLGKGEILDIHDVSLLGPEAAAEKEALESQDILSVLVLPLNISGELVGFVGFDNTRSLGKWTKADTTILKVASELFSNAFARLRSEQRLKESNSNLAATIEELKRAQSQMVRQEQMVAIGQIAAGVAHEINNPLAFILSNHTVLNDYTAVFMETLDLCSRFSTEALAENSIKEIKSRIGKIQETLHSKKLEFIREDIYELMESVEIGINRVRKIVDGLRYFSHAGDEGGTFSYDIMEGIDNTLIVAGSRLKGRVEVIRNSGPDIPRINCHGSQINQVLLNIIMNAVDAFDGLTDRKPVIDIEVDSDGSTVTCVIGDNGIGMDQATADKIFSPFFTTKPIGKGTGLGMSIAFDLVRQNKGEISVETKPGEGTRFTLVFPVE